MEESELPQSKIGSEEPIFASPLLKAGAEIAPHRGARAIGPPFHISRVNNNLPNRQKRAGTSPGSKDQLSISFTNSARFSALK